MSSGKVVDSKPIPLVRAAARLKVSYQLALNWILRGELKGWQDDHRHWFAEADDLERLVAERVERERD